MDKYKQKNNVNNQQRAHLCFSKLKKSLQELLRQALSWKQSSYRNESFSFEEQTFHRGWDLLFDYAKRQQRTTKKIARDLLCFPSYFGSLLRPLCKSRDLGLLKRNVRAIIEKYIYEQPFARHPWLCAEDLKQPEDASRCQEVFIMGGRQELRKSLNGYQQERNNKKVNKNSKSSHNDKVLSTFILAINISQQYKQKPDKRRLIYHSESKLYENA